MAKRKTVLKIFVILFAITMLSIFCPILVLAARNQSLTVNNTIKIEAVNGVWTNGNMDEISQVQFPSFVAPGESIDLSGGLFLKNKGISSYARFKPILLLNGEETNLISLKIDSNWVLGQDGYYYYCNQETSAQIHKDQYSIVINEIIISDIFKNVDSGENINLTFIAELVEADDEGWRVEWGEQLPDEWFIAKG